MRESEYHLSIDLEAELRKITRNQHLNRVHYLVQLIRHAVLLEPREIHVHSRRRQVEFSQDGRAVSAAEWQLLELLFGRHRVPADTQQQALSRLEERYGIALLSLVLTFPEVYIGSGTRRLAATTAGVEFQISENHVAGYRVTVIRPAAFRADEEREIRYFCSGMEVPLYFNGERINQAIPFTGQILARRFADDFGRGAVGIPGSGDLCAYDFFKNGIRFGIKQFIPADGRIVRGIWDSCLRDYERQYRASIQHGEAQQRRQTARLYGALRRQFVALDGPDKLRIKKILLGLDRDSWRANWGDIPLFHAQAYEFCFSLENLLRLKIRYGGIPFTAQPDASAPADVPRLLPEDVYFLRNDLAEPVRLYQGGCDRPSIRRRLRRWLDRYRPPVQEAVAVPARLGWVMERLNHDDQRHRFCLCRGASRIVPDRRGFDVVYLSLQSMAVRRLLDRLAREPHQLTAIRYALLSLAAATTP
ncbi:MAG: hypothetical protein JXQ27_09600 [Acidobacteria bacterium]|nr:hypothetical protein [Acidobacteriota bacterium]